MDKGKQKRKLSKAGMIGAKNMRPAKTKEEAARRGRKGGLAVTDATRFAQRKNCAPACPHYANCQLITTSKTQFKGKCALKALPPEAQRMIAGIYGGPEGMANAFMALSVRVVMSLGKDPTSKQLGEAAKLLLDGMRTIYGTKSMTMGIMEHRVTLSTEAKEEAIEDMLKGYLARRGLKVVPI